MYSPLIRNFSILASEMFPGLWRSGTMMIGNRLPSNLLMRSFFSSTLAGSLACSTLRRGSKDLLVQRRLLDLELMGLSNLLMKSITCSSAERASVFTRLEGSLTDSNAVEGWSRTLEFLLEDCCRSCWLMQVVLESLERKYYSISLRSETTTLSSAQSEMRSIQSKMLPVRYQRQSQIEPRVYCLRVCVPTHAVEKVSGSLKSFQKTRCLSLSLGGLPAAQAALSSSNGSTLPSYFDMPPIYISQRQYTLNKDAYTSASQPTTSPTTQPTILCHRIVSMADRALPCQSTASHTCTSAHRWNIIVMRGPQTFTLTSLLNATQIRPHLYQQILHDIKSPLEQVSIDLTHDNSLEAEAPRRPNIPPAPLHSPLNTLGELGLSRTHESVSVSLRQSPAKEGGEYLRDEVMESVLSPLDQQISFKEESRGAPFCGALMESILREDSMEIQLPPRTRLQKRRPIFAPRSSTRTIETVVDILRELGETQMALFLQLLRQLEVELRTVSRQREEVKQYLQVIYDKFNTSIEYLKEDTDSLATYRLLRRLRSANTCELVTKVVREGNAAREAEGQRRLCALLASLERLQAVIAKFMERSEAVEVLQAVYESLQDSFPHEATLFAQLQRLCESLGCRVETCGMEMVWREGGRRRLRGEEFVEGVSMNDCVVRLPKSFEKELQLKGFTRNQ